MKVSRNVAERGEDAIKATYKMALEKDELIREVLSTVTSQAADIRASHEAIKALHDAAKQAN